MQLCSREALSDVREPQLGQTRKPIALLSITYEESPSTSARLTPFFSAPGTALPASACSIAPRPYTAAPGKTSASSKRPSPRSTVVVALCAMGGPYAGIDPWPSQIGWIRNRPRTWTCELQVDRDRDAPARPPVALGQGARRSAGTSGPGRADGGGAELLQPLRRHACQRGPLPRAHLRFAKRGGHVPPPSVANGDGGNRTHVRGRETSGVYERSQRFDLALRSRAGGLRPQGQPPEMSPGGEGEPLRASPFLKPGPHPTGRGWADSHRLATN
jgi:hypothetical protein